MPTTPDPRWEYKVVTVGSWRGTKDEDVEAALNELDQAGWEVLTVYPVYATNKVSVVARRPQAHARRRQRAGAMQEE